MAFREVTLTEEERKALGGKFWKPVNIGDSLLGFLVKYQPRQHDFGDGEGSKTLHSYTFVNKEGETTHDANPDLHTKLQKAMRAPADGGMGLKPGARHACKIIYSGSLPTGKGSPMKVFKLEIDLEVGTKSAPPPPPPPPAADDDDIPF